MTRRQAVLAEMTAAQEEARRRGDLLSLEGRRTLYDLEAALETLEHRILAGREIVTDGMLQQAQTLTRSLLAVVRQTAA